MRTYTYIILSSVFLFVACSTGQNAFKRGDYYDATMQSVQRLRLKPNSEKATATLLKSYPLALEYYQQKIDAIAISDVQNKFVNIVEIYQKLNTLADEISRCPAALEMVKPVVYFHEQLKNAKELAAHEQYDIAMNLLQTGYLEDARQAYSRLLKVKKCKPNFQDIEIKLVEAEDKGTLKIVVEQIPVHSESYQVSARLFYNRMFSYLKANVEKQFVRFYKPEDAEDMQIVPHQILNMQFDDFVIGNLHEHELTQEYVSDSLEIGEYTDANGVNHPVMGVVKASVVTYQTEIISKGLLGINIFDYNTKELVKSTNFPGEFLWQSSWATFNGDERAVPKEKMELVKRKQQMPPLPQEMFLLFSDPIFANSSSFLRIFYKKQ